MGWYLGRFVADFIAQKLQPTNYLDIQKLADIQEFDNERIVGKICNK